MARYELVEGKSSKFWEVEVDGTDVHLAWGRIGTNGQKKTKSFASEEKAKAERDKLVKAKTRKGYAEVGGGTSPSDPPVETETETVPAAHGREGETGEGLGPAGAGTGIPPTASSSSSDPPGETATEAATETETGTGNGNSAVAVQGEADEVREAAQVQTSRRIGQSPMLVNGERERGTGTGNGGPDESTVQMPAGWLRVVHPRRGYPSATAPVKLDAAKAWKAIDKHWAPRSQKEKWVYSDEPERLASALAFIAAGGNIEPSDPEVQAVVARILGHRRNYDAKPIVAPTVDVWAATVGLVFATRAALASLDLKYGDGTELWPRSSSKKTLHWAAHSPSVLPRLRHLLSIADEATYTEAREVAAAGRGDQTSRVAVAFLFPTEREWIEESVAELAGAAIPIDELFILSSLENEEQLAQLAPALNPQAVMGAWGGRTNQLPSLMEGVGAGVATLLFDWLQHAYTDADVQKQIYAALSMLPGDAPMNGLLDRLSEKYVLPATIECVQRFPRRATRLLTERIAKRASNVDSAKRLLGSVLSKHPDAVDAVRGELTEGQLAAIAEVEASRVTAPAASADELPAILVSPPWTQRKKKRVKALVVKDVKPIERAPKMAWSPGEKEKWAARHNPPGYAVNVKASEWDKMVTQLRAGQLASYNQDRLLIGSPDHIAAEAVKHWLPSGPWYVDSYYQAAVARLELAMLEPTVYYLGTHLKDALKYTLPFDAPAIAPFVADAFARLKSARSDARAWMDRYPESTAAGVIPNAVGKAGKSRRAPEAALRYLKAQGHEESVLAISAEHGDAVRDAVTQILSIDPKDVLPTKIPKLPSFWDADALPALLLEGREKSLPPSAVEHVGTMLAMSKSGEEYPGLDEVIALCDPESLSRFAWEVFESWQAAGHPPKQAWAFSALAILGDDEVARKLTPMIRKWPGDGGHARAVIGLDVLAAIGTDVALMHLHGIAQKVKFKGLQKNARERIELIARARDLTSEELADRLVPDLGLDEDGSLILDYGERQFTVGFDENLKPFVLQDGKPRKSLPKPGAKDDEEKAPAAYKRFSALKKDARTAAKGQILRLELAMVGQRRWTGAQLRQFFLDHPLMIHLSRRLVWARYEADGVVDTFRVAEDGSLANASDDEAALADDAVIGIVHALDLQTDDAKKWGEVFGDYEILQPFTQLGRETYAIEEGEKKKLGLKRFEGQKAPTRAVIGLESRGWRRGPPMDGGVVCWMQKRIAGGASACLNLDPGIFTGYIDEEPEQTLDEITISRTANDWSSTSDIEIGELPAVVFSEIVRDITMLTDG